MIVKTKNHLIYSDNAGLPSHACLGECQKVWWSSDLPIDVALVAQLACPQCGGTLTVEIPEGHYRMVVTDTSPLIKDGAVIRNAGLNLGR